MSKRIISRKAIFVLATIFSLCVSLLFPASAAAQRYLRTNLVSDIPGVALRTDPNLINPWGVAFASGAPIWVANNNSGTSTLYLGDGEPAPTDSPLVVTIPPPKGSPAGTIAAPTGLVFNGGNGFVVSANGQSGPALFIFSTEDGTISGWTFAVDFLNAILVVDNSAVGPGAVYKGLALAVNRQDQQFLYATNFRAGVVEVYDSSFHQIKTFTDPNLPAGYAPFGIHTINNKLWVTFALQNASKHDDVPGVGNGFVDVFDADGNLLRQFAQTGQLNSPWGVALAPNNFGKFSNALLVGNVGDGRINAFEFHTGHFLGQLRDTIGQPLAMDRLWEIQFGDGTVSGPPNRLLFTAGIGKESHGLFGTISAIGNPHGPDVR